MTRRKGGTIAVLFCLVLGFAPSLEAQAGSAEARPTIEAARMPDAADIRIDGLLDEDAWTRATPITDFRQQEPVEGGEPTEPTEIRILYDAEALYIGAMFYDSEPDRIHAHQLARDAGLGTDDRFMWILDTFADGRTGYFFEINPAGLMGDGLIGGGGGGGRRRQQAVGRHLGGPYPDPARGLVRRDPHPLLDPQLRPGARRVGHQLPAHDPTTERGDRLERLEAQREAHPPRARRGATGNRRRESGHRAGSEAVPSRVRESGAACGDVLDG